MANEHNVRGLPRSTLNHEPSPLADQRVARLLSNRLRGSVAGSHTLESIVSPAGGTHSPQMPCGPGTADTSADGGPCSVHVHGGQPGSLERWSYTWTT